MTSKIEMCSGSCLEICNYISDVKHKIRGEELGPKVQAELRLNLQAWQDPIRAIDELSARVQGRRHTFMILMLSNPPGVIRSPKQNNYVLILYLGHLSKTALVTLPPTAKAEKGVYDGLNSKERRRKERARQRERQIEYDLTKLTCFGATHDTTDNIHMHVVISLFALLTGQLVVINGGKWKFASEYARQETMRDLGYPPKYEIYSLETKNGQTRVKVDFKLKQKQKNEEIRMMAGAAVPQFKMRVAEYFRGQPHPVNVFRAVMAKAYPQGRPPEYFEKSNPGADADIAVSSNSLILIELDSVLKKHNLGLGIGDTGELMISANGQEAHARLVDNSWNKKYFELRFNLKGQWYIGMPIKNQAAGFGESIQRKVVNWIKKARQEHPLDMAGTRIGKYLPWIEYNVEVTQVNGSVKRFGIMSREDLAKCSDAYLDALCDGAVALKTPSNTKPEFPLGTVTLRPVMLPGEMLLCIHQIPQERIDEFDRRYKPVTIIRTMNLPDKPPVFTAVLLLHHALCDRRPARDCRARLGDRLVREYGAHSWSDGFQLPDVPGKLANFPNWFVPRFAVVRNLEFSKAAQEMLPAIWKELLGEEVAWWKMIAEIKEKRMNLVPGTIVKNLNTELEFSKPLDLDYPVRSQIADTMSEMLAPLKSFEVKELRALDSIDEEESEKLQQIAVPEYAADDEEEEKRKRKRAEQQQYRRR